MKKSLPVAAVGEGGRVDERLHMGGTEPHTVFI